MPNPNTNLGLQMASWRTALNSGAGLTNVDQTVPTEDTAGTVQEKFRLKLSGIPKLMNQHGGTGLIEYETDVLLEISWDPEGRESTVWGLVVDDSLAAIGVVQKASNRVSNVQKAIATGRGSVREVSMKEIKAEIEFTVTHREAQDLT